MASIGRRAIPWMRVAKGSPCYNYNESLARACPIHRRHLSAGGANIPEENPVVLRYRTTVVHLLGTMHISDTSAAATRDLIKREYSAGKLGAIFLELDDERYKKLQFDGANNSDETNTTGPDDSLLSIWSTVGTLSPVALVEAVLRTIYRALHQIGFASGVEFKAAISAYTEMSAPVPDLILGDQHIRTTLKNIAAAAALDFAPHNLVRLLTMKPPASPGDADMGKVMQEMMVGNTRGAQKLLEKLLDRKKARDLVKPLRTFTPNISRAILDARDDVMAERLFREASSGKYGGKSIVAVVGLAHLDGIVTRWERLAKEGE